MELIKNNWFKKDYNELMDYLYSLEDLKYKEFHSKLTYNTKMIGIRIPDLKTISKQIAKGNYLELLSLLTQNTYEECTIYGLVISYIKIDFKNKLELFNTFIPRIDNWATCDTVCTNMKAFKKHQEEGYQYILKLLKNNNAWSIRVGLVLLLDFYINDNYIEKIITICDNIKTDEYYVQMAVAWLLSMCYIKYPSLILNYLNNNNLDKFTFNKTIQKIIESNRVDKGIKQKFKQMKKH